MEKWIKIWLCIIVCLVIFCAKSKKKINLPDITINKVSEIILEEKDDVAIKYIYDLVQVNQFLYLIERQQCKILKYDLNGKLLKMAGKKGDGPEEFSLPLRLKLFQELLYVLDANGFKINVYDLELNYINSIALPAKFGTYDFAIMNDSLLLLSTLDYHNDFGKMKVLKLFNTKHGIVVHAFGKCDEKYDKYDILNYRYNNINLSQENHLYLSFPASEKIYMYNLEGVLLQSIGEKIPEFEFVNQDIPQSLKWDEMMKLLNKFVMLHRVFLDDKSVFVSYQKHDPDLSFVNKSLEKMHFFFGEYDKTSGQLVHTFTELPGEPLFFDAVQKQIYLHVSEYPVHKIGVYKIEE